MKLQNQDIQFKPTSPRPIERGKKQNRSVKIGFFVISVLITLNFNIIIYGIDRWIIQPCTQSCFYLKFNPNAGCKTSCQINKTLLDYKLQQGLPSWAQKQIEIDLKPFGKITSADLDLIMQTNATYRNKLVRFKIKNGILSVERSKAVHFKPVAYQAIYDVLKYLTANHYLPDTDFIIGFEDYLIPKSPDAVPIFTFAKDLTVPLEKDLILMPDWMNLCAARDLSEQIKTAKAQVSWQNKLSQVFWRGGHNDSTGFRSACVDFSHAHPNEIDTAFVDRNDSKSAFVSPKDHLQYKYLLSIDGSRGTWERLVWQLQANSLVFKHDSTQVQWFYSGIKANSHYLAIVDLNDLLNKRQWAEMNPLEAEHITHAANFFAAENLSLEDMYIYIIKLIWAYSLKLGPVAY